VTDRLMTVKAVAAYLGMSERWVYKHALSLGATKLGNRLRFTRAGLDRYVERNRLGPRRAVRRA
jgi:excisionase family DNA binding protein